MKCPKCKSENVQPVQIVKMVDGKLVQIGSAKECGECDYAFARHDFKKPREA